MVDCGPQIAVSSGLRHRMAPLPRIDELKRRVQSDPASIAFAALAEEYRRLGQYEESVATCLNGLQRHPAYLSARVTLGRSLIELGRYDEARTELEQVLRTAPENLAAIRGLADIHTRRGEQVETPDQLRAVETDRAHTETAASASVAESAAPRLDRATAVEVAPSPVEPVRAIRPVIRPVLLTSVPKPDARPIAEPDREAEPEVHQNTAVPLEPEPAIQHIAAAPISFPIAPSAPEERVPHPDESAMPELEALLAAIVRARDSGPSDRAPGH